MSNYRITQRVQNTVTATLSARLTVVVRRGLMIGVVSLRGGGGINIRFPSLNNAWEQFRGNYRGYGTSVCVSQWLK